MPGPPAEISPQDVRIGEKVEYKSINNNQLPDGLVKINRITDTLIMFEYIILINENRSVKKGVIDKTGANGKFYTVDYTDGGKRRSRKRNQKKSKKNHKKRNSRKSRRHRR